MFFSFCCFRKHSQLHILSYLLPPVLSECSRRTVHTRVNSPSPPFREPRLPGRFPAVLPRRPPRCPDGHPWALPFPAPWWDPWSTPALKRFPDLALRLGSSGFCSYLAGSSFSISFDTFLFSLKPLGVAHGPRLSFGRLTHSPGDLTQAPRL